MVLDETGGHNHSSWPFSAMLSRLVSIVAG